jgi:phage head maturation protease
MLCAPVIARPADVRRAFVERRAAGGLQPGEIEPAALFRSVMLRALPMDGEKPDTNDGEPPRYRFVMSMSTPDEAHDLVMQDWDLSRFSQNPVAFFNHNSWGLPIGKWVDLSVTDIAPGVKALTGAFVPSDATETSRAVARQLAEGVLNACSVGFIPGKMTDRSKYPTDDPRWAQRGYVYEAPRLMECSIVGTPMHPDAIAQRSTDAAEPPAPADVSAETPAHVTEAETAPADADADALDLIERALAALFPVSTSSV